MPYSPPDYQSNRIEIDFEVVVLLGVELPHELRRLFLSREGNQASLSCDDDAHLYRRGAIAVHAAVPTVERNVECCLFHTLTRFLCRFLRFLGTGTDSCTNLGMKQGFREIQTCRAHNPEVTRNN